MLPKIIFISYSHKDKKFLEELKVRLAPLKRNGLIKEWYDGEIFPGSSIDKEIKQILEIADIYIFLVSANFLDSNYIFDVEMKFAFERQIKNKAVVIPVIIKPSNWDLISDLKKLKALPTDAKPITTWRNRDEAWTDVINGIRLVVSRFHSASQPITSGAKILTHNLTNKESIPYNIFGRTKEIKIISEELDHINNPLIITSGFGGIGKSTLAKVVVWDYIEKGSPFNFIVWIDIRQYFASQRITFNFILDIIAKAAGMKESDFPFMSSEEIKQDEIKELLGKYRSLLILDNYEDLSNFPKEEEKVSTFLYSLPKKNLTNSNNFIKVLITTREISKGLRKNIFYKINLRRLSLKNSIEMMKLKSNHPNKLNNYQYKRIWELLGGLPKYMEIAIEQLETMVYSDWEKMIQNIKVPIDKQERFFNDLFKYSWKRINRNLKKILLSTTYFTGEVQSPALQNISGLSENQFWRELAKASDIYIESTGTGYTIHPLTHAYCTAILNSSIYANFKFKSSLRFIQYYIKLTELAKKFNDIEPVEKEIRNIVNAAKFAERIEAWESAIELRSNVTEFIRHRGYWQEEIEITESAVTACRRLDIEELLAKYLVFDLGWLYLRLEKTDNAEQVIQEGLRIFQKIKDHKGEAQAKRHLGKKALILGLNEYYEPNKKWDFYFKKSEKYYTESLRIRLKLGKVEDQRQEIADMKLDFGRLYWLDGQIKRNIKRLEESNDLNWQAMEIFEEINNMRGITKTWGNLGNTTKELCKLFIKEKKWLLANKNIIKAEEYYEMNLKNGNVIMRKDEISHALWGLSEIYEMYADNPTLKKNLGNKQKILTKALDTAKESHKMYKSLGGAKDINATKRLFVRIKGKL